MRRFLACRRLRSVGRNKRSALRLLRGTGAMRSAYCALQAVPTKAGVGRLANGWATKTAIADVIRNLDPLGSPGISA